ncbi:MAG: alpha/beta fold hydrolase [Xanthobacteraceae bacterium]
MSEDRGASYQSVWKHMMTVPFRQDYVMADGLRTRYVQAGSPKSPALLLLHGTGGHWETFCANLGAFSEHFNCYAVDMMGCGFTDKPDKPYEIKDYVAHLVAFMNEVGLTSASIVGVSLGAWVATRMALAHPDRVDKMILISPPGLLPLRAASASTIANRRASAADPSWENISKVLSNLVYDKTTLMDDMVAVRQRVYSLPGIEQIMPRMLTLFDPDIRARNNLSEAEWRSLRKPVLVIGHIDSPDLYLETADKIMDLLPMARRVNMRKTAHWSHLEDPETFNRLAIEFLQQKDAAAA